MGSEVPGDIDVGLKKPEIQADAADIEDFPKITSFNDLLNLINRCRVLKGVTYHQNLFSPLGQMDQVQACLRRVREGFFDKDVFPLQEGKFRQVVMGKDRRGNCDRVNFWVAYHVYDICCRGDARI